jgi:hypothetical protein
MSAILSVGAISASCAPSADCAQIVRNRVMIDYRQNGRDLANDYYERYGILIIVYVSSVDFFPITGKSQMDVGNAINASGREVNRFTLDVQDIAQRCDAEFEEFNTFATNWNDSMYSRLR